MRPVVLVTVKRTGTLFFSGVLAEHYGEPTPIKSPDGVFYLAHCYPHQWPLIERRAEGKALITTDRHWPDVESSWTARGWDLADYRAQREVWEMKVLPRADCVLSVDADDRAERLAKLSECLGVDLSTDWQPVNQATCRRGSSGVR